MEKNFIIPVCVRAGFYDTKSPVYQNRAVTEKPWSQIHKICGWLDFLFCVGQKDDQTNPTFAQSFLCDRHKLSEAEQNTR